MNRRSLLGLVAAAASGSLATGAFSAESLDTAELAADEFIVGGDKAFGRALLFKPRATDESTGVLILLHGLGETHDQKVGVRAFAERYGLLSAVKRLVHPPLVRTIKEDYFGEGRLEQLNQRLVHKPFRCPYLLCAFTPNPYKTGGEALIARYAEFLAGPLRAAVEQKIGRSIAARGCMVAGVSLGGYLAIEAFLKKPEHYGALGLVQAAFGRNQAARYAAGIQAALERTGPRRIEILTSSWDPYRAPNELLHKYLKQRQQPVGLRVSPGPHDQRWLRESAMIETLVTADEVFDAKSGTSG